MFEIVVNGKDQDDVRKGDTATVNAYKCWGLHCEQQEEIVVVDELETIWSDDQIWTSVERYPFPADVGGKPIAGDRVIIPAGMDMTLDEDTAILDYLEINGNLTFDPTKDVTLHAKQIFIRDGIMISGTADAPTTFKHEIHLK